MIFDNPLAFKYLIKKFLACNGCFGLFSKIKRGLGLAFGAYLMHDFPLNCSLIHYQWTKCQCHTFLPSQDKQNELTL